MAPAARKLVLTAHVSASLGWFGALAAFFAHAAAALISQDAELVRAADLAMGLIAFFVIVPLCLVSLITGLVQALGTSWGLFRNYWVVVKRLLTILATAVLLLKLEPISYLTDVAAGATSYGADLTGLRISLAAHGGGGLLVLLAAAALAVYKPRGLTAYGVRTQRASGANGGLGVGTGISTPRWFRIFGGVMAVLFVLIGVMVLAGGHGPARTYRAELAATCVTSLRELARSVSGRLLLWLRPDSPR